MLVILRKRSVQTFVRVIGRTDLMLFRELAEKK